MAKQWIGTAATLTLLGLLFSGCKTTGHVAPKAQDQTKATATKPEPLIMRINCGATEPYTDKAGNLWAPDQLLGPDKRLGTVDGSTVDRGDLAMAGTDAPKVYETERYSMTAYKFAVPNGKYSVRLHFAETFDGITAEGQRVFSVTVNGKAALEDFDVWKAAGGFRKPVVKEVKGITADNGELIIGFTPKVQNPEVNGIEIIAE